jgi:hypothetical protein
MTSEWSLVVGATALPVMPLSALGREFESLTFLWFDLDGAHFESLPYQAPGATHVWGWNESTAVAARLEQSEVVAGTVVARSPTESSVRATARILSPWMASHVGRIPPNLAPVQMVTLELPGPLEVLVDDRWVVQP